MASLQRRQREPRKQPPKVVVGITGQILTVRRATTGSTHGRLTPARRYSPALRTGSRQRRVCVCVCSSHCRSVRVCLLALCTHMWFTYTRDPIVNDGGSTVECTICLSTSLSHSLSASFVRVTIQLLARPWHDAGPRCQTVVYISAGVHACMCVSSWPQEK